ncbi:MAG: type II secretion system minor pseudopilin GspJ [Betaproteobacteria bacterium]
MKAKPVAPLRNGGFTMNAKPLAPRRHRGFTLLEVLLALAIMAMLAVTGYRALTGMLDAEQQITHERQRWRDLDLFFARFEYDLGHVLPRAYRVGGSAFPGVFLREDGLALVRGVPGATPQRIGYRYRDSHIELVYWPQLDAPAVSEPVAYTVADDIATWQVSFANRDGIWVDRWGEAGLQPDDAQFPRGARVVLILNDGTRIERVFALR